MTDQLFILLLLSQLECLLSVILEETRWSDLAALYTLAILKMTLLLEITLLFSKELVLRLEANWHQDLLSPQADLFPPNNYGEETQLNSLRTWTSQKFGLIIQKAILFHPLETNTEMSLPCGIVLTYKEQPARMTLSPNIMKKRIPTWPKTTTKAL